VEHKTGAIAGTSMGEMIYSASIERTAATDEAVDLISFGKKKFRQVGPVLASNAGDQGAFSIHI
jgi:hypothetical protein